MKVIFLHLVNKISPLIKLYTKTSDLAADFNHHKMIKEKKSFTFKN